MKPIIRYTGTIAVTAVVALGFAFYVLGSSSAQAEPPPPQTAPQPAPPTDKTAPPPVQQPDTAAASSSAPGGTAQPGPQPAASNPAATAPGAGAGSAAGAPGAAAPAAGKAWYDLLVNREVEDLKGGNFWMPKAVNLTADDSDLMYYAVLGLSIFFFFGITAAVIYFVIKYRHRPGHKAMPSAAHNDALEITWTVIPTLICVFLFYYGWRTYVRVVTPPNRAVEVNVLAWRWNWQFTHSNGVQDSDLHVPVNTPVRLVMTSKDVLHSFYAPVMRVKQDIIPRRYTYAWFYPTKPGTYRLTCAEYGGTNHSLLAITNDGRRGVVVVHEPGGYERYLADKAAADITRSPEDLGKTLYEKKGCNACHTLDGTPRVGPSWKGVFGTTAPLSDGSSVKVDENYIRESILYPQAKSRPGFPPSMPSFEGQLKEKEIEGLIAFIKSLK